MAALLVPFLLGSECAPGPDEVDTIEEFVACVNDRLEDIPGATVVDTVQCLPPGCTVTLTQSNGSAQPACSFGGCQLPRVILDCPGPPRFMPSYSFCVTDPAGGSNRVEIGEVINTDGHMRMADVDIHPGDFEPILPTGSVVSKVKPGGTMDTTECWVCHQSVAAPEGAEAISKPEPYEIFGQGCVIATDEPGQKPDAGEGCDATVQSLADVCECIALGVNEDGHPLDSDQGRIVSALCDELEEYRTTRGVCGSEAPPAPEGPECDVLDEDCDPYQAGVSAPAETGYTCQVVAEDVHQCVSTRECVEYQHLGGGKFLDGEGKVSFVRVAVSGRSSVQGEGPICDSSEISAEISAFHHGTNTLVDSVELTTLTATQLGGGDFSVDGEGSALVDGLPASVRFESSKSGSDVSFLLEDADTSDPLAGGDGEAGRADFELTETPYP